MFLVPPNPALFLSACGEGGSQKSFLLFKHLIPPFSHQLFNIQEAKSAAASSLVFVALHPKAEGECHDCRCD